MKSRRPALIVAVPPKHVPVSKDKPYPSVGDVNCSKIVKKTVEGIRHCFAGERRRSVNIQLSCKPKSQYFKGVVFRVLSEEQARGFFQDVARDSDGCIEVQIRPVKEPRYWAEFTFDRTPNRNDDGNDLLDDVLATDNPDVIARFHETRKTIATGPGAEQFNPADWENISWTAFRRALPPMPQPPPSPLAGAEDYKLMFIQNLRKKTSAKTAEGRDKFQKRMKQLWSDRKRLYRVGKKLLQDAGFFKQSQSPDGPVDSRNSCPRCGCTVFDSNNRQNMEAKFPPATVHEKLVCHDCGYVPREHSYWIKSADVDESKHSTELASSETKYCPAAATNPRLTPQQFVTALLIRGQLEDIADPEKRKKLVGSYLILCEKWLPRDVQQGLFVADAEETLKKRADRLSKALKDHERQGDPLPVVDPEIIGHLQQRMEFAKFVP